MIRLCAKSRRLLRSRKRRGFVLPELRDLLGRAVEFMTWPAFGAGTARNKYSSPFFFFWWWSMVMHDNVVGIEGDYYPSEGVEARARGKLLRIAWWIARTASGVSALDHSCQKKM